MSLSNLYTELHRFPLEGQGVKEHGGMPWHYIAFRWREEDLL